MAYKEEHILAKLEEHYNGGPDPQAEKARIAAAAAAAAGRSGAAWDGRSSGRPSAGGQQLIRYPQAFSELVQQLHRKGAGAGVGVEVENLAYASLYIHTHVSTSSQASEGEAGQGQQQAER